MRKLFLFLLVILFSSGVSAQTWKKSVYGTMGNKSVRTIRLKPVSIVTVRSLKLINDSITWSTTLSGKFDGATDDSLRIRLDNISELKVLGTGIRYSTTIPGRLYLQSPSTDTGLVAIRLSDIDYLSYHNANKSKAGGIGEGMVFASIFMLVASPFICIDYKDGTFNAERYKYWAIGSTAVLFGSISIEALLGGEKRFQFHAGWPTKKQKVWTFNKYTP